MGKMEPRKARCRCRKFVDYKEADDMVKRGEALWFVVSRERGMQEKACRLCSGLDQASATCDLCKGTGKMNVPVVWDSYNTDIVLVNHRTKSNKVSTPRVPTIESEHIERAYCGEVGLTPPKRGESREWIGSDGEEARQRIEEYGLLILEARAFVGPKKLSIIKEEPADNFERAEGRRYDYGRSL